MKSTGVFMASILAAGVLLGGCNLPAPGTTRNLGKVQYGSAFAAAIDVMRQHFSLASADPDTGVIRSRPKLVKVRGERLLGGSPARHVAEMTIRRKDGLIVAHASVALQREGSAIHQTMGSANEGYDSVPNRTPAEEVAAVTPEQNEIWRTQSYDRSLERRILDELYRALHPARK